MTTSSSSVIPTSLAHADNQGKGHPRGGGPYRMPLDITLMSAWGLTSSNWHLYHSIAGNFGIAAINDLSTWAATRICPKADHT
ncbi:hypothetical protein TNCV_3876911 [Trichonephila clavipes]|uniref:Uncharacterized protein n=1 Tax=Trichonephila clavipes TaxID=2585209 RepID=A0A8X6SWM6_TRICX|nr:hypothetical protein TNCV_3876911 [Trichonephila clavipes]